MRFLTMLLLHAAVAATVVHAQVYVPGQVYLGANNNIEYQAGNIPLVISVPHGGRLEPSELPDRDCDGCSYVMDSYTQELAREIRDAFVQQTGCYPHVVYNLLHRKKLDMNRDLVTATDSNTALDAAWNDYHRFITAAKDSIVRDYGKGLFIDLHGHGHTKQRIEFGYLLYGSQLREKDSLVNTAERIKVSSIRNLVSTNRSVSTHAELLRGSNALGTLFANDGYPGVPSKQDPFPVIDDPYFNGGYNTLVHGSSPGGTIDAIQMELYSAIRFNASQRLEFARSFANILRRFLDEHYIAGFSNQKCQTTDVQFSREESLVIYPNPASEQLTIRGLTTANVLIIVDMVGRPVLSQFCGTSAISIDIRPLAAGMYGIYTTGFDGAFQSASCFVLAR